MKLNKIALSLGVLFLSQNALADNDSKKSTEKFIDVLENQASPILGETTRWTGVKGQVASGIEQFNNLSNFVDGNIVDLSTQAYELRKTSDLAAQLGWSTFSINAKLAADANEVIVSGLTDVKGGFSAVKKTGEILSKARTGVDGFVNKTFHITNITDKAGTTIDVVNKTAGALTVVNNFILDMNKAGPSDDAIQQVSATFGAVGLSLIDGANIWINDKNPLQVAQLLTFAFGSSDACNQSSTCSVFKAAGDPLGTVTDMTRLTRNTFDQMSSDLEDQNASDEHFYTTMDNFLQEGIWSSEFYNAKVYSSESFDDLLQNANAALDFNLKNIDSFIRLAEMQLSLIDSQIDLEKSKPWFLDWGSKDINLQTHEMRKNMVNNYIERLKKRKNEIENSRNRYLEEYGLGWLQAQEVKHKLNAAVLANELYEKIGEAAHLLEAANEEDGKEMMIDPNELLISISRRNQYNTSHFGTPFFRLRDLPMDDAGKGRLTVQEKPYLPEGSAIVHAPADIVLSWGNQPADLDSHLTGPLNANTSERFHINYRNLGSLEGSPHALLYRDDTSHHAGGENRPEQTRINITQPGVYNFYVHDYTNKNNPNSQALSSSNAVVSLHSAGDRNLPEGDNLGQMVSSFSIPTNRVGTVWHSFELDTRRNTIRQIDTFYSSDKLDSLNQTNNENLNK